MKIKIKNLGPLKQAEFELGDLTIICGENNTGKTYATYALYGFLHFWRRAISFSIPDRVIDQLLHEGTASIEISRFLETRHRILSEACREYLKRFPVVFATKKEKFKDTEFDIILDSTDELNILPNYERRIRTGKNDLFLMEKKENAPILFITLLVEKEKIKITRNVIAETINDALKEIIFSLVFPNVFIASAERTGSAIFRKELNFARNRLLEEISQSEKNIDPFELLFKVYGDYALPVKRNVDFSRQLESTSKQNSFIWEHYPEILSDFTEIIGGEYSVTRNDELFYIPKKKNRLKLTMDESSSAVRSLLDIGFYLKHVAKKGDLFIIDEPELNLHPKNQRKMARLFSRLIKIGIKVFITTHSDYIIKELNTLIMLNQDNPYIKEIAIKEGYKESELLPTEHLKVFIAEECLMKQDGFQKKSKCQTLTPASIDQIYGIEARSFDLTIDEMNRIQDEIVWGKDE